jgi:hypothetical protein
VNSYVSLKGKIKEKGFGSWKEKLRRELLKAWVNEVEQVD